MSACSAIQTRTGCAWHDSAFERPAKQFGLKQRIQNGEQSTLTKGRSRRPLAWCWRARTTPPVPASQQRRLCVCWVNDTAPSSRL